jgi:hypothetical protein
LDREILLDRFGKTLQYPGNLASVRQSDTRPVTALNEKTWEENLRPWLLLR